MGVIKRGLLGGFSGRVGSIVGTSWKGIAVIKSLPLSVANPKTAAQVAHRTDFKLTVLFGALILALWVKPLWDRFASKMSGFNAFVQQNVDKYKVGAANPYIDFIMTTGKMAATAVVVDAPSVGDVDIVINWVDDSGEGLKLSSDIAFAVCYNETSKETTFINLAAIRSDGNTTVHVPAVVAIGDKYDIWSAFKRADGTVIGQTTMTQTVAIA